VGALHPAQSKSIPPRSGTRKQQLDTKGRKMKRDWEIIRAILVGIESSETPNTNLTMRDFDEYSEQEVAYNMRLLSEANCIDAHFIESKTGDHKIAAAYAKKLTPKGHDLLDAIRNDSVWAKIKEKFESKGLDMTIDLVIGVGKRILDAMLA
jgi:hypothetical protein